MRPKYYGLWVRYDRSISRRVARRVHSLTAAAFGWDGHYQDSGVDGILGESDKWPSRDELRNWLHEVSRLSGRRLLGLVEPRGRRCRCEECNGLRAEKETTNLFACTLEPETWEPLRFYWQPEDSVESFELVDWATGAKR